LCRTIITQTYHGGGNDQFIEIKNNSTVDRLLGNRFFLALYQDGALTTEPPTSFIPIPTMIPNEVWIFRHSDATEPMDALDYALQILLPAGFDFDGDNDILILTTTSDATAYNNRIDLAGNTNSWGFKTSWVRSSCAAQAPRTDAFDTDDWVEFTREEVVENQTNRTNPRLGRHNSDVLVYTLTGGWQDNSIDGSRVERSRAVNLSNNYSTQDNGSFECCSLQLAQFVSLTISPETYISVQINVNVLDGASINVENNGSLVMVKDSYNGLSGNELVNLGTSSGVEVVKETVGINSIYDYVYWSSPLTLNPINLPANSVANLFPAPLYNPNRFYGFNNANMYDQYNTGTYPNQTSGVADGYDDNSDDYFALSATDRNALMTPGRGYTTWPPVGQSSNYNINFNGQTNNGIVRVPVYRNDSLLGLNDNLVGNPYPSAIDLNRFFEVNASVIDPYAAIWGKTALPLTGNPGPEVLNYSEDGFLIYSPTMPITTVDQDNLLFNPEGILASCQSFFVHTTTDPTILPENNTGAIQYAGDVIFNNSTRSTSTLNTFARGNDTLKEDKIWLNLKTADHKQSTQIGIAFLEKGVANYSAKEDVKAVHGRQIGFYTKSTFEDLIIDAQSNFDSTSEIPLGLSNINANNQKFEISLAKFGGLFKDQAIYLADMELGVVHNLSKSAYSFSSDKSVTDNRFVLQFTDIVKPKLFPETQNEVLVTYSNDEIVVTSSNLVIKSVIVSDIYAPSIGGLLIAKYEDSNTKQVNLCLSKPCKLVALKITMEDGSIMTKKLAR
jgi:hypothetical protein